MISKAFLRNKDLKSIPADLALNLGLGLDAKAGGTRAVGHC